MNAWNTSGAVSTLHSHLGCHPSVKRYVRHARGWCADGVRTVRGGPEASCPVPPARTARRKEECVARTYGTEAPGRYVSA